MSPARLHQVPVTVPPGCPRDSWDTIAPFVPHHQGITAISIKVKEVSHGKDGWMQKNTTQFHSTGPRGTKTGSLLLYLTSYSRFPVERLARRP